MTSGEFLDQSGIWALSKEVRLSGQYRARSEETRAAAAMLRTSGRERTASGPCGPSFPTSSWGGT